MSKLLYADLSHKVIGLCFKVHSGLGCGLPEYLYHRALMREFVFTDLLCTSEELCDVDYLGETLGVFRTDIIVENKIILELKSVDKLTPSFESQLLTYMTVTGLKVGFLINFGVKSLKFKRFIKERR